jgi:hypothetical protein
VYVERIIRQNCLDHQKHVPVWVPEPLDDVLRHQPRQASLAENIDCRMGNVVFGVRY